MGGRGRWRAAHARCSTSPADSRPGRHACSDCPGARHLREGGRGRAQPRVARPPPARGGGVGRAPCVGAECPRLLDVYDDGDWVALAFEAVDGRPPAHPWDGGELHAVGAARSAPCTTPSRPTPCAAHGAGGRPLSPLFGGWAELAALAGAPAGPGRVERPPPRPAGRARVGVAGRRRRVDAAPRRRALRQLLLGRRRRGVRGLAARVRRRAGPRPGRLGALGAAGGRPRARGPSGSLRTRAARGSRRGRRPARRLQRVPRGALAAATARPGCPRCARFQAAQGEVALAWLRRRTGW